MDELESKCGDDAVFYSVPRQDPGVGRYATSRATYCWAKMNELGFSKKFVVWCSETIKFLEYFD